ncbi:MAG: Kojibiose phosphorylase [Lentisphaerae bacterium ADurb.BinA184]|nr:MAG: Kojibiose phosphorylase [Lentisphaerae bacterium ADurb.BinA184]
MALARAAAARGYDTCRAEHIAAYRRETDAAAADFDDNPATVQGFAFSQMHLHMAFGYDDNRVGVPIKGLTGHGYRFVNFWDMDFHMFPYFLLTKPRQARHLLEYRFNQLPAYRENARRWGARGAQVPWETSTRGVEETAPWLCLPDREIHISADAARMFWLYDELTPDRDAMLAMGAQFIMETARFYASRITWGEGHRRCELRNIGCPDQYHTFAHNNLFTSLMARWNLEQAAATASRPDYAAARERAGVTDAEVREWQDMAARLFIPAPGRDGIIEQCNGFFDLDPDLDGISELFCRHSQAVKQADVIAAFGPFEEVYPAEVRRRNWHFYNDRTLHGSSLSLPGMAYGAARCGLNDEALYQLHKSARMDLDDVNLDTERGVHVSAGAVQWYTVVFGFGGLTARREGVHLRPNLPRQWRWLRFTVHWQFRRLRVEITPGRVGLHADSANDGPVRVRVGDGRLVSVAPGQVLVRSWRSAGTAGRELQIADRKQKTANRKSQIANRK